MAALMEYREDKSIPKMYDIHSMYDNVMYKLITKVYCGAEVGHAGGIYLKVSDGIVLLTYYGNCDRQWNTGEVKIKNDDVPAEWVFNRCPKGSVFTITQN